MSKLTSILIMGAAVVALSQPAKAQLEATGPVSRAELRDLLIRITELLDRSGNGNSEAAKLRQRIDSLDAQAFERLYQFSNNWQKLRIAVALMSGSDSSGKKQLTEFPNFATETREPLTASPAGLPANLFSTSYPTGSNYATFRATLPGLGAMTDTAGSVPGLDDERCDANFEAGVAIAAATFAFANIIAENVCEALPELADIPCWIAQGVLQGAAEANNTVAAQCAIVDGAVDASEIEAGYENTVAIYKNLDAHHLALRAHDTDVKAAITNVTNTLTVALTKHDTDIKTAVAGAVNTLVLALTKHDGDIKSVVATHDAAIKSLLTVLQGGVDNNTQQLKVAQTLSAQVIRLLLTPEGSRVVNPAVLTCTGDNCPKVLDCPGKECSFPIIKP